MNLRKITISCLLVFAVTTLAFSQFTTVKSTKKYFQMPAKITSEDYASKTVILKIKKEYRAQCSDNQINIAPLEQYLNQLGANGLAKKFPHALPPVQERNKRGERYADLSLIYEFQYTADIPLEKVINRIYSLKFAEYTQPHYIHKLLYTPNDPQIGSQGHLSQISAYAGWDISKGDTNVVIGITDTGFDINHPDLQDNVKYNYNDPINGVDDDGDGYIDNFRGWDLGENDNNPQVNGSDHGVHVSGCAAPSTDNGIGIAGPGFNCRLLPVKISDAGGALTQGYAGITYAADHGADIINCSWGSSFGGSLGQDVIDYATINKNALVIGGAGNNGNEALFYPAAYEYVISVAWLNSNDVKNPSSSYGSSIDVCAPGTSILSTGDGGIYYNLSGTSMASPIAAGCAAMVKAQYPFLTALQVGEQLKVTCDDIYPVNGSYIDKLGNGRVNLFTALSGINTPSVVMTNRTITDGNDNAFVIGDTLSITGVFVNYLAVTGNINVTLTTSSPYINIIDGTTNLGVMAMLGTVDNNADPFLVEILPTAPLNTVVDFELLISDGSYSKKEFFNVTVNVDYINIAINDVATSITSKGLIGFNDFSTQLEGLGFIYPYTGGGINMLFEGGVMIGVPGKVSDWLRDPPGSTNNDFGSVINVKRVIPNVFSEFDLEGTFNDDPTGANKLDIEVNHKAFAWTLPGHLKYVIVEYNIKNTGAGTLNSLYAGIFADWDIMDFSLNNAAVDNTRNMGYCWSNEPGGLYAGIQLLTSGSFVHYAIDNDGSNGSIDIYTSYNTAEKYTTLSTNRASAGQRDVTHVVSSGPFNIAPGDSVIIAFAMLADSSLTGLQLSADAAYCNYNFSIITATISSTDVTCGTTDGVATVTPTGGTPPFTYQWDANAGSQTDSIAIGLDVGSYSVTVTDANGCSEVFTVNLSNANAGIASASVVLDVTCFGGNDGQATSSITGGTPPYTYSWDNGDTTAATTSGLTAGDHTIQITDSMGCISFQTITIDQSPQLTANIVIIDASCSTCSDGSVDITVTGGTPGYVYLWDFGATTEDILNVKAATYFVTVTDANSCDTTFIAIVGAPIGLVELSDENSISVYPNPNNGQFSIQFNGVMKDVYTIEVRNILGQTVYNEEINISGGPGVWIQMDLSNLNKGVYLLNVINSTSERAYELIVIY